MNVIFELIAYMIIISETSVIKSPIELWFVRYLNAYSHYLKQIFPSEPQDKRQHHIVAFATSLLHILLRSETIPLMIKVYNISTHAGVTTSDSGVFARECICYINSTSVYLLQRVFKAKYVTLSFSRKKERLVFPT